MNLSYVTRSRIVVAALLAGLCTIACSSDEGDDNPAGTGGAGVGGSTSTGGKSSATGGKSAATTATKTGGAPSTGGTSATGGVTSSGTPKTGGAPSTGGTTSVVTGTGGAATGGVSSTTSAAVGGAGVGGITSAGGSTTTGGSTSDAGPSDAGANCDGCLTLFVPLAAEKTGTDFETDFGALTLEDLSMSVVTARVYVEASGNAGGLRLYAKNDTTYESKYSNWTNLADLAGDWHEISLDLAATDFVPDGGTGFDKTKVRWIGLTISAGDTFTGAVFGDVTVYVDWVTFSDGAHADFMFDANAVEGFAINKYNSPIAGSLLNGTPVPN